MLNALSDRHYVLMQRAYITVYVTIGSSPDTRNGPHHVHPADLNDRASDSATQSPLHGQQWDSK